MPCGLNGGWEPSRNGDGFESGKKYELCHCNHKEPVARRPSRPRFNHTATRKSFVQVRRARVNRGGFRLVKLVRLETARKHGFIVQPACLVYEFVRPVSTFVSPNVRPASTDFGIGCFSGGALVTSRSSRVYSHTRRAIALTTSRPIVPVSE